MSSAYHPLKIHEDLGDDFYDEVRPASFPQHIMRYRNQAAAEQLGLGHLSPSDFIDHFARFKPLTGSLESPLALRYHGHQFGIYNPDLGDGRGFLFAQLRAQLNDTDSRPLDLGTKGSGQTPYARGADGRLTLKGAVRELLATEMLEALAVPTSKTLSVIETGEPLHRHDEPSPTRSAVLVRVLHSHIRIGSFQRLAYHRRHDLIEKLLRHVVRHYYTPPDVAPDTPLDADAPLGDLIPLFLRHFSDRLARMIAGYMVSGFVHGVLNTDNFNITGESFDYGPWRFLPYMDVLFTAAYFDESGRYAYGRQPDAALWSLCRLADCFVFCVSASVLGESIARFHETLERDLSRHVCWRLGLAFESDIQAQHITAHFFRIASRTRIGWADFFQQAYAACLSPSHLPHGWSSHPDLVYFADFLKDFSPRQTDSSAISHLRSEDVISLEITQMESLWQPIVDADDWSPLNHFIERIRAHGRALRAP